MWISCTIVSCTILPRYLLFCSSDIFIKKWEIQKLNLAPVIYLCKYRKKPITVYKNFKVSLEGDTKTW